MRKTWHKDEEEYLEKNYHKLPDDVLSGVLKKSQRAIAMKAFLMGLQKDAEAVEANSPQSQVKYREETPLLADIICFYHRRNVKVGDIAKDVHCPPRQVREILERCMDNGMYERYVKAENSGIQFKPNGSLHITGFGVIGGPHRTVKKGAIKDYETRNYE